MKNIAVLAALLVSALVPAPAATIIVVRHADRAGGMSANAPLSPRGEQRARDLARVLRDANIRAIFTTEVRRTQQTAEPTAQEFHRNPTVIPAVDLDLLISRLRSFPSDETVLVVGHGNTVPAIVEKLGGGTVPPLGENEYDRMIIVVTRGSQRPAVLTLRYGAD